jgi:hypothetical protein
MTRIRELQHLCRQLRASITGESALAPAELEELRAWAHLLTDVSNQSLRSPVTETAQTDMSEACPETPCPLHSDVVETSNSNMPRQSEPIPHPTFTGTSVIEDLENTDYNLFTPETGVIPDLDAFSPLFDEMNDFEYTMPMPESGAELVRGKPKQTARDSAYGSGSTGSGGRAFAPHGS